MRRRVLMRRPVPGGLRFAEGGLGLILAGLTFLGGSTVLHGLGGSAAVVGRVGPITVTATDFSPGRSHSLSTALHISTSAPRSDQLDVALAAGGRTASVYHRQVSVGEVQELAACDGTVPSAAVVSHWLHYGPLMVPGRSYGNPAPASATLDVAGVGGSIGRLPVTLYFAHAGKLTLDLPVSR